MVTFDVSVSVSSCPADASKLKRTFEIYPVGLAEKLQVSLDLICECDCEKPDREVRYCSTPWIKSSNNALYCTFLSKSLGLVNISIEFRRDHFSVETKNLAFNGNIWYRIWWNDSIRGAQTNMNVFSKMLSSLLVNLEEQTHKVRTFLILLALFPKCCSVRVNQIVSLCQISPLKKTTES